MKKTERCDGCGEYFEALICVTNHPDKHDGYYCCVCNPYNPICWHCGWRGPEYTVPDDEKCPNCNSELNWSGRR